MKIRLYSFDKVVKSTGIVLSAYTEVDVQLKDSCSLEAPEFIFSFDPAAYNYIYVPTWNRYYFMETPSFYQGRWFVPCAEDYLASWKSNILANRAMILYASGINKNIPDKRIPATGDLIINDAYDLFDDLIITGINNQGCVIISVTGNGSFGCYIMDDSTIMPKLLDGVDDWWGTEVNDLLDCLKQMFFGGSAANCLKSAIALPLLFTFSDVGPDEQIYLGNYPCKDGQTPITGVRINKPIKSFTANVAIPWEYNDWRRNEPYSQVILYVPFVGIQQMPTNQLINDSSLDVKLSVNLTSGDFSVEVKGGTTGKIVSTSSGNMAMNTPFGSTGIDTGKIVSSGIAGLGGVALGATALASGGASLPAVLTLGGGLATAAAGTINGLSGNQSGSGGLGGGASHALDPAVRCYVVSKELSDSQANCDDIMGKPYMGVASLSSFSGYIQTEGFEIHGPMLASEKNAINSLMDSGVYIE